MLVLGRRLHERVVIDNRIVIQVVKFKGDHVRLGFVADPSITILRGEVADRNLPGRPAALPNAHTEVERLRSELEKVNRLDAALVSDLSDRLRDSEAENARLLGQLAALRAEKGENARLIGDYVQRFMQEGK